jgi:hypothetical protein
MVMQADILGHFADPDTIEQQLVAFFRMGLDQGKFFVGQFARLVQYLQWNHRLAEIVEQACHAGIACLLLVQPEFSGQGNHQGADCHRVHVGVVVGGFQARQADQGARITQH